jgi:AcrR family transcriptional regulator
MSDVKQPRPTHRQRQALETRARIVVSARRLFASRGYVATTIQAIADESGVAVPTIYDAFHSKRGILEGARLAMLEESEIPELMTQAIAERDAHKKLELAAKWIRQQMERSSDVIRAFREGSRFDPDVASDHRRILDNRGRSMERFIDSLADALPGSISKRDATDLLWAFSNEELYRELVEERGWSPDRFERWLFVTLHQQLLLDSDGSAPDGS